MNSRKAAIFAGVLFIIGTVAGILSIAPSIDSPDYLIKAAANATQVLTGAYFQFIMIVGYVGIAIVLYPILSKSHDGFALGFVAFRVIVGVFIIIGVITLPLLLTLSQEFVKAGAPDSSYFQTIGELLRSARDLANHVALPLALGLGDLMFYYILYRTKLVPQWLSAWGLAGTILVMLASTLFLFRLIGLLTPTFMGLTIPLALQQMVLAVWLLVKGFHPATTTKKLKLE